MYTGAHLQFYKLVWATCKHSHVHARYATHVRGESVDYAASASEFANAIKLLNCVKVWVWVTLIINPSMDSLYSVKPDHGPCVALLSMKPVFTTNSSPAIILFMIHFIFRFKSLNDNCGPMQSLSICQQGLFKNYISNDWTAFCACAVFDSINLKYNSTYMYKF